MVKYRSNLVFLLWKLHNQYYHSIREEAVSTEAIHLASAIEFGKAGHIDAEFIVKRLAEDPERFGPYLRDALKRIDEEFQPKMPVEKALSTYYYKNLSGWYLLALV